jgi:hypothetical protein
VVQNTSTEDALLREPIMEKLTTMRLLGIVDALKAQEQDPASGELRFLERLGSLADQRWNWRENQALAAAVCRQAEGEGLCRRHRLSHGREASIKA